MVGSRNDVVDPAIPGVMGQRLGLGAPGLVEGALWIGDQGVQGCDAGVEVLPVEEFNVLTRAEDVRIVAAEV
jgi:hypothetical protein